MNLTKAIQTLLAPELKKLGFALEHERKIWTFYRDSPEHQDRIELDQSDWYPHAIRVYFITGSKMISYHDLRKENQAVLTWEEISDRFANLEDLLEFAALNQEWLHYEDEASLERLLLSIVAVSKNEALAWFEQNQPEACPIPLSAILTEAFQESAYTFFSAHHLKVEDPSCLNQLEQLLTQDRASDIRLEATFFLGEVFRTNLGGGVWTLKNNRALWLERIGGYENGKIEPYLFIEQFKANGESLYEYYQIWEDLIQQLGSTQ
ncbi:hypothetical protein OMP38_32770 [Cohnella ginsengisoli]|uniref:Uncharacterized protein n=1 Tax=Cohnella ginsengisoli TaxID=425004 RepID=A0A9X4KN98_9BACL|nr:hypothetical protein [Cohnella ginsengisoli]MDG0795071.1 hypothetical protein [Cohnella ginsengisoli]